MSTPVIILNANMERETGRKAQSGNINAAKAVADVIRTCLGPRAMLKMLLDPMGGIVLTNDGNAILREIDVTHPAAKSMIELSRTQDEEVGDGTTSVIILAGEILALAEPFLNKNMHPTLVISGYRRALEDAGRFMEQFSIPIKADNQVEMMKILHSCLGTKLIGRWGDLMCNLALQAVKTIAVYDDGRTEVDIKRYARVEKIPGGDIEDCCVLSGVMLNKDIVHPKMRRRIENPKVLLLDCALEYKKGESQTNIEISKEEDFSRYLKLEEDYIENLCKTIIDLKPDLVITEKGVSDLASHFLMKANITAIRRVRKTDNNRIARATGAIIVNQAEEAKESDLGTKCGLFYIDKIGDDYFVYLVECRDPKACTIVLRGASKDILNEVDRNLQDAMCVARNIFYDGRLVYGGGATEIAVSHALMEKAKTIEGVQQGPYKAVAEALEVIPRTLIQNSGASPIRVLTELRAKHASGERQWGVDGNKGIVADMQKLGILEPLTVKLQTIKTAVESACLLLRVDDIVSGLSKKKHGEAGTGHATAEEQIEETEAMRE